MNLWSTAFFTDDQLEAEIRKYVDARRAVRGGNPASVIRKVQGEGRLVEFAPIADSMAGLDADLRAMMAEARRRGLAIGGDPHNAIAVEIGL